MDGDPQFFSSESSMSVGEDCRYEDPNSRAGDDLARGSPPFAPIDLAPRQHD